MAIIRRSNISFNYAEKLLGFKTLPILYGWTIFEINRQTYIQTGDQECPSEGPTDHWQHSHLQGCNGSCWIGV